MVSDNKLIEGISSIGQSETQARKTEEEAKTSHVVRTFWGSSKKGYAPYNPRKRNQYSILMKEHKQTGTLMLCVLDGHGEAGDLVSHFITDHLARKTFAHKEFKTNPGLAMRDEALKLEKALLKDASIDTEFSGTTAVLSCIRERTLTVANIGDSRVIVGRQTRKGMKAVEVSIDHKPDREDEQKRIVAKGGRVFAVEYDDGETGPPRVWLGHLDIPGLAMSRSLGDSVAHTAGVISEPEIFSHELAPEDKIIVMASDGLWEFMSNQEVIDMIVKSGMAEPRKVVDMLVTEASSRWMREEQVIDDTTIIVAYLR